MKASDKIAAALPAEKVKKPRRAQKPGLLHSSRAIEIEQVSGRMTTVCRMCAERPKVRRVTLNVGGGRYGKQHVYCIKCGRDFLDKSQQEYVRAIAFLVHGCAEFDPDPLRQQIRLP